MKVFGINPKPVNIADFEISAVTLGEIGRGRKLVHVSCPKEFKFLETGVTRTGKFRLQPSTTPDGWVARVTTEGSYVRGANGNVSVHPGIADKIIVGAKGSGAFGEAGRTGQWDDLIFHTNLDEFWIRVEPSREPAYILLFTEKDVAKLSYEEAELLEFPLCESTPSAKGSLIRL